MIQALALARLAGEALDLSALMHRRMQLADGTFDFTHWTLVKAREVPEAFACGELPTLERFKKWLGYDNAGLVATSCEQLDAGLLRSWSDVEARIESWMDASKRWARTERLLSRAAKIAWLWHRSSPLGRGDMAFSIVLADAILAPAGVPALMSIGLRQTQAAWGSVSIDEAPALLHDAVEAAGNGLVTLERSLVRWLDRARTRIEQGDLPANALRVCELSLGRHSVTSKLVRDELGVGMATAIRLLERLTNHGLLVEVTNGGSYRRYRVNAAGALLS